MPPFLRDPQRIVIRDAQRFTRRLALSHYENFLVGGLLTPKRLRQDFYNIYAYCRIADDLADEIGDEQTSIERLDQWGEWLLGCYQGRPAGHPVFEALGVTIERFAIPREPFLSLLDAFRQDQHVRCYDTFAQLLNYCRRSANPVGHLVLYLGHSFDAERARWADQICTGLQLANFWQDVRRDFSIGRVYLPQEDLARFGVELDGVGKNAPSGGFRELMRFEVERTEGFFHRGLPLSDAVPAWMGRNVQLFAGGGLAALEAIRRAHYDVWRRRPTVTRWTRMRLIAQAWLAVGSARLA